MNKITLTALKKSIIKWEKIVEGKGLDKGKANCPLCKVFYENDYCLPCPVSLKAKESGCSNTPYIEWDEHHSRAHDNCIYYRKVNENCPECLKLAEGFKKFLKSLLPKKERK